MIRIITGTLIEVGDGRKNPDAVMEILASKDRAQAGYTAPGVWAETGKGRLWQSGMLVRRRLILRQSERSLE